MANKRTQKVIERMTNKLQSYRYPMSTIGKIGYYALWALLLISVVLLPTILKSLTSFSAPALIPIIAFSVIVLVVIVVRKKKLSEKFWKVTDTSSKVDYIKVDDISLIFDLFKKKSWVFGSSKEELTPFIYNWFLTSDVITENTKLNVYYLPVSLLREELTEITSAVPVLPKDQEIFIISLDELDMTEAQENRIDAESNVVRPFELSTWLTKYFIITKADLGIEEDEEEEDEDEEEDSEAYLEDSLDDEESSEDDDDEDEE